MVELTTETRNEQTATEEHDDEPLEPVRLASIVDENESDA